MSAECPDAQISSGYYREQVQTIEQVQKCKLLFTLNKWKLVPMLFTYEKNAFAKSIAT